MRWPCPLTEITKTLTSALILTHIDIYQRHWPNLKIFSGRSPSEDGTDETKTLAHSIDDANNHAVI